MSTVTDRREVSTQYGSEILALMIYVKFLHERVHVENQQEPMASHKQMLNSLR